MSASLKFSGVRAKAEYAHPLCRVIWLFLVFMVLKEVGIKRIPRVIRTTYCVNSHFTCVTRNLMVISRSMHYNCPFHYSSLKDENASSPRPIITEGHNYKNLPHMDKYFTPSCEHV